MAESESTLQRTPLHAEHLRLGGRLVPFAGWELPLQFSGLTEEHRAVRQAAGLFDVSHMGEIVVRGAGAEAFLERMTPNSVARLLPGRAHYSGLLTERGTYLDDLLVYRLAEQDFLLVVNAANAERDLRWLEDHADRDVEVEDFSEVYALLALQGPRAEEILQRLTGLDLAALRYYGFASDRVAARPALVSRTGYTGEDGFELYVDSGEVEYLWRELLAAGAEDGLLPAGLGARDTLRLEAGMALYGHELDESTTPYQAGLGWTVKLAKGEFTGRSALAAEKEAGVQRSLVGFAVRGRRIPRQGAAVLGENGPVGAVTSGSWSPTFEKAIGMAYVPPRLSEPGRPLAIEVRGRSVKAEVVELPFYRRPRE